MKQLLYIILISISSLSFSASMPVYTNRDGLVFLEINGDINYYDSQQFINIAESWRRSGSPVQIVLLNSGGGSVIAGYDIAYYIMNHRISTIVANGNLCASSCVNIFLAGQPRLAETNSSIGVHRASVGRYDTASARSVSIDMSTYYKSMNVPANIRLAMLETPPHEMYYLSNQDKKNISTIQLNYQEANTVFYKGGIRETRAIVTPNSKQKARVLNKEAIPLIWNNQLSLAILKLEEAKKLSPSDSEVLGNLGFAYQKAGDLVNAQINFTASLKLSPKRGATWGNLADLLADTGQIDWATDAFVNYYNYSKNKQAALNLFYEWLQRYPNMGRGIAVKNAMAKLGLY